MAAVVAAARASYTARAYVYEIDAIQTSASAGTWPTTMAIICEVGAV